MRPEMTLYSPLRICSSPRVSHILTSGKVCLDEADSGHYLDEDSPVPNMSAEAQ
jgi:hypothetical protein